MPYFRMLRDMLTSASTDGCCILAPSTCGTDGGALSGLCFKYYSGGGFFAGVGAVAFTPAEGILLTHGGT